MIRSKCGLQISAICWAQGAALIEITENGKVYKIAYTGDIGRPMSRILKAPEPFGQCDYLITESTYGNRLHPHMQDAEAELLRVVTESVRHKRWQVDHSIVAIGRTQELVLSLNNFSMTDGYRKFRFMSIVRSP